MLRSASALVPACLAPAALKSVAEWHVAPLLVEGSIALVLGFVLGLPTYLFLKRVRLDHPSTLLLAGLLIAVVPLGILFYPGDWLGTRATVTLNGATTMIDGRPTAEGWRQYLLGTGYRAFYGVLASATFLLVLRRQAELKARAKP